MSDSPVRAPQGVDSADDSYHISLESLKQRIRAARVRAAHAVNAELISVYWHIGKEVLRRKEADGNRRGRAGSKIVQRLSADLRTEFPDMAGFRSATFATCGLSLKHGQTK